MGGSMEKDHHRVGHFLMGVVVLTWGINFGLAKSAYQDIPPVLFAAIRFTISGLLIFLLTFWRERSISIRREDLRMVAAVGGLGLGLYQILWSLGLHMTSASNSALILSTQPLLGALYMELVKKEPVGKRQYLGMILALGGVILVILKPTVRLHFSLDTLPGDLLTLVAGVCAAIFFSAWSKPLLKIYSPLRLMGYCMLIGSLVLWLATLFLRQSVAWDQVGVKAWGALGYAIFFSGVVGHTFWYVGIGRIGVTRALVYLYFIPVCAVLFNFSFMGEKIFIQQLLGGGLILWGVHRSLRTS
jgi:drug/metabolite transporter (DMT)-like permease